MIRKRSIRRSFSEALIKVSAATASLRPSQFSGTALGTKARESPGAREEYHLHTASLRLRDRAELKPQLPSGEQVAATTTE